MNTKKIQELKVDSQEISEKNLQEKVGVLSYIDNIPLNQLINYQFGMLTEYSAFTVDNINQFSQAHDSHSMRTYLINQAEMRNAMQYKVANELEKLNSMGQEVVDEYKKIAKDNIKKVRRSIR